MRLYLIFWICYCIVSAATITLGILVTVNVTHLLPKDLEVNKDNYCALLNYAAHAVLAGVLEDPVIIVRQSIAISYLFVVVCLFMLALNIKVLFIYYKFGDRLSDRAS